MAVHFSRGALRRRLLTAGAAVLGSAVLVQVSLATPLPESVSGTLNHGATITISGSGFGSKAGAAPLVWDNASAAAVTDLWTGAWPDQLPGYNLAYYAPMRGIGLPHTHVTRYLAGAQASNTGADTGYNVLVWKSLPAPPLPYYIYASWYQRADDQWHFGGDNNFKTFDYSAGTEPYALGQSWYTCYGPPHPNSNTDTGLQWTQETGTPLSDPDQNGHNAWWGQAVNPMAGQWSKVEIAIRVSSQSDGYINIWENGQQVMNYAGVTDNYGSAQRSISIGGYARMQGYTSNWRYFDDIYVDTTLARVVLADKPVLSQASIVELQIPSAWSDGSISAQVNLGKFTQGQTAYLFVVDASGNVSKAADEAGARWRPLASESISAGPLYFGTSFAASLAALACACALALWTWAFALSIDLFGCDETAALV
jgi:hypothetical protein